MKNKQIRIYVQWFAPFLLFSLAIQGQSALQIDAGINHSHFGASGPGGGGSIPSNEHYAPQLGVHYESRKHTYFFLGIELNYREKDAEISEATGGRGGGFSLDGRFQVHYLSLLVLPELRLGNEKKIEWYLNGGLYLGRLISSQFSGTKSSYAIGTSPSSTTVNGSADSYFSGVDGGYVLGSGLVINLNENYGLTLNGRGMLGRINTSSVNSDVISLDLGITIGILFHFKHFNFIHLDQKKGSSAKAFPQFLL